MFTRDSRLVMGAVGKATPFCWTPWLHIIFSYFNYFRLKAVLKILQNRSEVADVVKYLFVTIWSNFYLHYFCIELYMTYANAEMSRPAVELSFSLIHSLLRLNFACETGQKKNNDEQRLMSGPK